MGEDGFNHLLTIRPVDLRIEPFRETANVRSFDCGNAALNDFLNNTMYLDPEDIRDRLPGDPRSRMNEAGA